MSSSETVDPEWKGLYRTGGIAWIIVGVLYFVEIPMFFLLASSLSSGQAALNNLAGQAFIAQTTIGLAIVSHLISIPSILALYLSLKGVSKNAMLVAVAFLGVFLILDMAVSTPQLLSLITLSQNYAAATSDAQRAALLVTANYAFSLSSTSTPIYGSLVPSIGVLITGLVMRKGIFKKGVAFVGIAAGTIGIVAGFGFLSSALTILDIANLVLFGIWLILLGSKLIKLGKR